MPLGIDDDPTLDTLTITAGGLIQIGILDARQHYPAKFLKTLPTATDEVLSLVEAASEFGRHPAAVCSPR